MGPAHGDARAIARSAAGADAAMDAAERAGRDRTVVASDDPVAAA